MKNHNESIIQVNDLTKRFDDVLAVDAVNFDVSHGELFGFLGPNGAGKTTIIRMLTGLARPDSGTILINGIDCTLRPRSAQHLIGVVPDDSNLYPELSGFENLCFCASLYGMGKSQRVNRARKLLDTFNLSKAADRKFGGYSKGMKRKLTIAAGIIHEPEILFLDEPTTGIDVVSARQLRQIIVDLHHKGTTIFLTTHYIEEAERMCERIAFIMSGRIVRVDSVLNLIQPIQEKYGMQITCNTGSNNLSGEIARAFPTLTIISTHPNLIQIEANESIRVGPLVRFLEDRGVDVSEAKKIRLSLEDVFMKITGIDTDVMRIEKETSGGRQ